MTGSVSAPHRDHAWVRTSDACQRRGRSSGLWAGASASACAPRVAAPDGNRRLKLQANYRAALPMGEGPRIGSAHFVHMKRSPFGLDETLPTPRKTLTHPAQLHRLVGTTLSHTSGSSRRDFCAKHIVSAFGFDRFRSCLTSAHARWRCSVACMRFIAA